MHPYKWRTILMILVILGLGAKAFTADKQKSLKQWAPKFYSYFPGERPLVGNSADLGGQWYGACLEGNQYFLRKVQIEIKEIESYSQQHYWSVVGCNNPEPGYRLFIFRKFEWLSERELVKAEVIKFNTVPQTIHYKNKSGETQVFTITLNGPSYVLDDSKKKQAIETGYFEIDWAGDLDGDDKLDLIIGFEVGDGHRRELYLSSLAKDNEIVGKFKNWP